MKEMVQEEQSQRCSWQQEANLVTKFLKIYEGRRQKIINILIIIMRNEINVIRKHHKDVAGNKKPTW